MSQPGENQAAADIAKYQRRAVKDQRGFENTLAVLSQSFDMRMPEAREKAEKLRDNYLQMAVNLDQQIALMGARARRNIKRAEKIGKILEVNRNRNLIRARHDATPELLVKPRSRDPIQMLLEKNKLDTNQERAAREIAKVYQAVVAALMAKISRLGIGRGPKHRGSPEDQMPEEIATWHHDRYLPWARALAQKDDISLPLVIDVAVDGHSVNAACRYRRVGYQRGVKLIGEALTLYAEYRVWDSGESLKTIISGGR